LAAEVQLKDQKDKISYSIGLDIGTTLKRQVIEVNEELLNTGIQDGLSGKKPLLSEDQVKETMALFQKEMLAKQAEAKKAAAAKNSAEGTKFLAENKTKEGVKTTASGLQYKVLKEGSGPTPKPTDTVKVNYRGTVLDGTEFDSSYKRGEPASFPVNRVIKGWTEALQLMKVGSKYQLFIPADLAYGGRGAGSDIGPNAMLIFDVELLGINPPTPTPPKPVALPKAAGASASPSSKPGASASLSPSASPKAAGPASPKPSPSP
jgi:FKBP-type peptidyl-prolyl cis-trans isomerase